MKPLSRQAQALIDSVRAAEQPSDAYRAHMRRRLQAQLGAAMGAAAVTAIAPKAAMGAAATTAVSKAAAAKASAANGIAAHAAGAGLLAKAGMTLAILGVLAGGGAMLWRHVGDGEGAAPVRGGIEAFAKGLARPSLHSLPEPVSLPGAQPALAEARAAEKPAFSVQHGGLALNAQPPLPPRPAHPGRQATAVPRQAIAPSSPAPHSAPPAHPAADNALKQELALLSDAQGALSSGQADRALGLLEKHAAAHSDGALREERLAARVFALCALGRRDEAQAEARRFILEAPRSPLAARVRTACSAAESAVPKGGPAGESSAPKP